MKFEITIRKYQPSDAKFLAEIFYNSIHSINIYDYSAEQINAMAPTTSLDPKNWEQKWSKLAPFVALSSSKIVGFAEFEPNGHIDCFYVHHEYQGKGVGSALMKAIEAEAKEKHISRIYADVSITAKSFFVGKGFQEIKKQTAICRGCEFTNFLMEKNYILLRFK